MALSPLLHRLFVCVTFAWNIEKLVFLQQTVSTVLQYPTHVDVCVVTNDEAALANVLLQWDQGSVWVCKTERDHADSNRFALLYEHRHAMKKAFLGELKHPYTAYMLLEDDAEVPWEAMLAWAEATPRLDPLGFIYGFYRVEWSNTGEIVMLDAAMADPQSGKLNLADYERTVHVEGLGDFIQHPKPFNGMWVASHAQLEKFISSKVWSKEGALSEPLPAGIFDGYAERSTWWMQLIDVPAGFLSRSVIPVNLEKRTLNTSARVWHIRNGYAAWPGVSLTPERTIFQDDLQ